MSVALGLALVLTVSVGINCAGGLDGFKATLGIVSAIQTIECNRLKVVCTDTPFDECNELMMACAVSDMALEDLKAIQKALEAQEEANE